MDDAIRAKTYRGQTVEEAAQAFQADAAEAARAGYVPTSQQWDGPILTVVYQRQAPTPVAPTALSTVPPASSTAGQPVAQATSGGPSSRRTFWTGLAIVIVAVLALGAITVLRRSDSQPDRPAVIQATPEPIRIVERGDVPAEDFSSFEELMAVADCDGLVALAQLRPAGGAAGGSSGARGAACVRVG